MIPRSSSQASQNARPNSQSTRPPSSTRSASRISSLPSQKGARRAAEPATPAAGSKRKERDFDADDDSNISVVVRCRGRTERETRENSAVVVRTDGVKGEFVELSMGPNALSNKSYSFDRVFSPSADQGMVFEDVVKPMLDEVLAGYNCTIFAYGQTGTGKTYTMSGDMTETMGMLSDAAGIIPRVLHSLFGKMGDESVVKCSFIELYNEELRDLISTDESTKLKIYEDANRRGHSTVVQGMEEKHIKSAADGIRMLQDGSLKRKVAATRCNDLSSRSHTVFTITAAHIRQRQGEGEDYVTTGKLNLVDLAGSENIQRSGAENKRAAEAGLINKSLLTLGRVINALVDRSPHIPYRESKLTRLLQDSLGGRTKTCIIATVSPAKDNLEETISTLDYAFRAKNIRNRPQVNLLLNKHVLLQDFASEIERLKSELIATRQRNGVYLSNDAYEEMSADRESRRIVMEEQSAKISTLEVSLRGKVTELFELTASFVGLKKDHDSTRTRLQHTTEVLEQTEIILDAARTSLTKETALKNAHAATEAQLRSIGGDLISTLHRAVGDVDSLHAKEERRVKLDTLNRGGWAEAADRVVDVSMLVEGRAEELSQAQAANMDSIRERVEGFFVREVGLLKATQEGLEEKLVHFERNSTQLAHDQATAHENMNSSLQEVLSVRGVVKSSVTSSLEAIAAAAHRMASDVQADMASFHIQLQTSYTSLEKEISSIFNDLVYQIREQKEYIATLRAELESATAKATEHALALQEKLSEEAMEEHRAVAKEREDFLANVARFFDQQAASQQRRASAQRELVGKVVREAGGMVEAAVGEFGGGVDAWGDIVEEVIEGVQMHRKDVKGRLRGDWTTANNTSSTLQDATKSIHTQTLHITASQSRDLDSHMALLDDLVSRARSHNDAHNSSHSSALASLSSDVAASFGQIKSQFGSSLDRVRELEANVGSDLEKAPDGVGMVVAPLVELRDEFTTGHRGMVEYVPTGQTPRRTQYFFETELPRTVTDEDEVKSPKKSPTKASPAKTSPVKQAKLAYSPAKRARTPKRIYSGPTTNTGAGSATALFDRPVSAAARLRELDPNLSDGSTVVSTISTASTAPSTISSTTDASDGVDSEMPPPPPPARSPTLPSFKGVKGLAPSAMPSASVGSGGGTGGGLSGDNQKAHKRMPGVENVPPGYAGGNKRKSPRLN